MQTLHVPALKCSVKGRGLSPNPCHSSVPNPLPGPTPGPIPGPIPGLTPGLTPEPTPGLTPGPTHGPGASPLLLFGGLGCELEGVHRLT